MDKEKILTAIAPCSLCCHTCPAMKGGIVEETAAKLHHYLEGYCDFNRETLPEQRQHYADAVKAFVERLDKFAHPACNGCRNNPNARCCIGGCFILECTREHGVDFCAECGEFPCGKLTEDIFIPTVISEWRKGNERIKEVGIERFYEEITSRSHYLPFKKQ